MSHNNPFTRKNMKPQKPSRLIQLFALSRTELGVLLGFEKDFAAGFTRSSL